MCSLVTFTSINQSITGKALSEMVLYNTVQYLSCFYYVICGLRCAVSSSRGSEAQPQLKLNLVLFGKLNLASSEGNCVIFARNLWLTLTKLRQKREVHYPHSKMWVCTYLLHDTELAVYETFTMSCSAAGARHWEMLSAVTLQLLIVNSTQVHSATVNQVLTITVVHICVTITIVHICVTDKLCRRVMVCTALNGRKDLPLFSSLPSACLLYTSDAADE